MHYEYSPHWLEQFNLNKSHHMAKTKSKSKRGGGDDVILINKEDWKGRGAFPTAPGGKYRFKFDKSSSIKPGAKGNLLHLVMVITSTHNGKKTEHKGIKVFDNIAAHVGWKIAQVLRAMGVKKAPKKMTLKELLKMILAYGKEIRAVIGKKKYMGKDQNPVLQFLPLEASKDEDDDDIEDEDDDDDDDEDGDDDEDSDDDDEEDSDDDDDDDDDDEDDSSSRKKKSSKKSKSKKRK
jgi:hypothetical protein